LTPTRLASRADLPLSGGGAPRLALQRRQFPQL